MKRKTQLRHREESQQALAQYRQVLQKPENLSPVTTHNYLSNFGPFIAWSENHWREEQEEHSFTLQAVAPTLLILYRAEVTLCWLYITTFLIWEILPLCIPYFSFQIYASNFIYKTSGHDRCVIAQNRCLLFFQR